MSNSIKRFLKNLPVLGTYIKKFNTYRTRVPAGHFYSPIVSTKEIKRRESEIYPNIVKKHLPGIDLNEKGQMELFKVLLENYYSKIPFDSQKKTDLRYYYDNKYFGHADATSLYYMMRHFKPKQIIEVGSGYSSAVMLDTIDQFFEEKIKLTFIEPYPDRLNSLLNTSDKGNVKIIVSDVQGVSLEEFEKLESGDFLFIDSTHVSKTGSDVNYYLFDILPRLKPGVFIHIHDIFYPFEYPKEWVIYGNGRFGWNEGYILRAFLMNQADYEIVLFNDFVQHFHKEDILKNMPNYSKHGRGGSIYLRKLK